MKHHHPVFKPKKKGDLIQCAYLYRDGHVVTLWSRRTDVGEQHYVQIAETVGIKLIMKEEYGDRLVFHSPVNLIVAVAAGASTCEYIAPALGHGSENTKRDGILIGHVRFYVPHAGYDDFYMTSVGGMSGPAEPSTHSVQVDDKDVPETWDTTPDRGHVWSGCGWTARVAEKINAARKRAA